jgi:glycolate oxidase FAD binding subunit
LKPDSKSVSDLLALVPSCESLDPENYSIDGTEPSAVLAPKDHETLSRILEATNNSGASVFFEGSGTKIQMGNPPSRLDLIILTKNLSSVLEYVPEDLTISIQAGIKLRDLKKTLAKKGQFVPLDPLSEEATIGGVISTNSAGPLRAGYGGVKSFLLGVKVANADGRISKAGGKVVKNVSGYDLTKLYIGALGTLGGIVEANLKVYPNPESESTLFAFFTEMDALQGYASKLVSGNMAPAAMEFLNREIFGSMKKYVRKSMVDIPYCVAIRFFGSQIAVSNQAREAERIAGDKSGTEAFLREESSGFWSDFSKRIASNSKLAFKASVPRSSVFGIIGKAEESLSFYLLFIYAEVSVGLVNFALQRDLQVSDYELLAKRLAELRNHCEELGGNLVITSAPRELKNHFDAWGKVTAGFALMKSLKEKFDPNGILSPGRFVNGL